MKNEKLHPTEAQNVIQVFNCPQLNKDIQDTSVGKVQDWIKTNAAHQHEQENCKYFI